MKVRNILVPTNFSTQADRALNHGIELVRSLPATLHVLHAHALAMWCVLPDALPVSLQVIEAERQRARLELERIRRRLVASAVRHQMHLSGLGAVPAILDVTERHSIDLIVMGSRGSTGLLRRLLGGVAERTARLAACPVVVLRDSDEPDHVGAHVRAPHRPSALAKLRG